MSFHLKEHLLISYCWDDVCFKIKTFIGSYTKYGSFSSDNIVNRQLQVFFVKKDLIWTTSSHLLKTTFSNKKFHIQNQQDNSF